MASVVLDRGQLPVEPFPLVRIDSSGSFEKMRVIHFGNMISTGLAGHRWCVMSWAGLIIFTPSKDASTVRNIHPGRATTADGRNPAGNPVAT